MLEPWIIEQIKKEEEERRRRDERIRQLPLELPVPELSEPPVRRKEPKGQEPERGVVIIDYSVKGLSIRF
jgi:hypothetical protein